MVNDKLTFSACVETYLNSEHRWGFGLAFIKCGDEICFRIEFWKWIVYIGRLWKEGETL